MSTQDYYETIELYKKWHRYGFMSIKYWTTGDKVIIDIGSTANGVSNTECFIDAYEFLAYLRAEIADTSRLIYPNFNPELGTECKPIQWFGGSKGVSRVFKIDFPKTKDQKTYIDDDRRVFKCGHFQAQEGTEGQGVQPNWQKPISQNFIIVTLRDISVIAEILSQHLQAFLVVGYTDRTVYTKRVADAE